MGALCGPNQESGPLAVEDVYDAVWRLQFSLLLLLLPGVVGPALGSLVSSLVGSRGGSHVGSLVARSWLVRGLARGLFRVIARGLDRGLAWARSCAPSWARVGSLVGLLVGSRELGRGLPRGVVGLARGRQARWLALDLPFCYRLLLLLHPHSPSAPPELPIMLGVLLWLWIYECTHEGFGCRLPLLPPFVPSPPPARTNDALAAIPCP